VKGGSSLLNTDPYRDSFSSESFPCDTIVFIPLRGDPCNPDFDWAASGNEQIDRRCPKCLCDSIVGHGRRRKQAHDETHDWIGIRRGACRPCHLTFTFLPVFSLPYTHYSVVARSQALRRYFLEHRSLESAAPPLKDPNRVTDPSTLRRWFRSLDPSSAFSFLRSAVQIIADWVACGEQFPPGPLPLSWPTLFPFLQRFRPLRL
jgi:Domain of unknown function (DUF6431)